VLYDDFARLVFFYLHESIPLLSKMVKIAIAGGAGSMLISRYGRHSTDSSTTDVAQEIIDVLVAENKHEILIMTRQVSLLS
jgi:hypothetical protein